MTIISTPAQTQPDQLDSEGSCCEDCCDKASYIEYVVGECIPDGGGGCKRSSSAGGQACCSPAATDNAGLCCGDVSDNHSTCLREVEESCQDACCKDDCCEDECCASDTKSGDLDIPCGPSGHAVIDTCCTDNGPVLEGSSISKCTGGSNSCCTKEFDRQTTASEVRRRVIIGRSVKGTEAIASSSTRKATDRYPHSHVNGRTHAYGGRCGLESTFRRFFEAACCCLVDWGRATRHHHHHKRAAARTDPHAHTPRFDPQNPAQAEKGAGRMLNMLMSVQGMDCPSCATKVTRALLTLPSVSDVKVNSFTGQTTLSYTEGIVFPADIARRAGELTGFTCTVLEEIQTAGESRVIRIGISAEIDTSKADLPSSVRIVRSVGSDESLTVLDVEYDTRLIKPREVVASFTAWDGVFVPSSKPKAGEQIQKELLSLFKRTTISALLCIHVLVFAWAPLPRHPIAYGACSLALTTAIQLYVATPIYSAALRSLFLQHILDMDLLVVLSTSIAYTFSVVAYFMLVAGHEFSDPFFETSALLVTLIVLGRLISAYARRRATSALANVHSLQADSVELIEGASGVITTIPADLVHVGDLLRIQPHTLVPTDGSVVEGHSQVDESSLTGESVPVEKAPGASLTAGTLNGPGVIHMRVAREPANNTVADIGRLLAQVQDARLPVQDLADRVAGYLAPAILAVASITFAVWIAVGIAVRNQSSSNAGIAALRYAIAVLVISCPCALVLCVPMVVVIATGVAGKNGVLFKSIEAVQYAKDVKVAVFDKTGTLTTGSLRIVEACLLRDDKLDIIHALVSSSRHPVSHAIKEYLRETHPNISLAKLHDVESIPGCGIKAKTGTTFVQGGSPSWLDINTHPTVIKLRAQALTMFAVTSGGNVLAVFGLADTIRASAAGAIKLLHSQGCEVHIVSGDAQPVVTSIASQLGIPVAHALGGCLPQRKLERVRELQAGKRNVMFVGDGTNDALALAQANIGISLGSGADLARSSADVVLLDPEGSTTDLARALRVLFGVSRAAVLRISVNFAWAFVYNLVAVLFAAGAFVHVSVAPQYAGLGEMVSVVPVVLVAWSMWMARW